LFYVITSLSIFTINKVFHGHIGIGVMAVFIYLSVHSLKVYKDFLNYEHKKYEVCNNCGGDTVKSSGNSNSDFDIYYCSNCKTYFKDYHVWPIS
jgi:hypothetical protein